MFRGRRSCRTAPAVVHYTVARNDKGKMQPCIVVECMASGTRTQPTWGHKQASMRRALATLSAECECGRRYHSAREFEGAKITLKNSPD